MPEMIPMPDNPGGGAPPNELTRQLSPEEERSVLLNFMGNMYGEAKKMDGNIVGESTTLKRGAGDEIKKQIEQVYAQPQHAAPVPVQSAPPQVEIKTAPPQVETQQPEQLVNDSQLSFNFNTNEKDELISSVENVLSKLNLLSKKVDHLTKIVENSNVTSLPIKRQTKKKSA